MQKFFTLLILLLGTGAHAAPLSNILPVKLVHQLVAQRLWNDGLDSDQSPAAKNFKTYWQELTNKQESAAKVVDNIFATFDGQQLPMGALPPLYQAKIVTLRYLLATSPNDWLRQVESSMKERYVYMAISVLDLAQVEAYRPILENFQKRIKAHELKIVDLSPEARAQLSKTIPESHGIKITEYNQTTRTYTVRGLYNEEQHFFGIDFARPLQDTLVTFAHEVVHAGDPQVARYSQSYARLLGPVSQTLANWLGGGQDASPMVNQLLSHVYFELGISDFLKITTDLAERRIKQLQNEICRTQDCDNSPTEQQMAQIRELMRDVIGLTVENEYRAYGFSIAIYAKLRYRFHLMAPDRNYQEFLGQLIAGDREFATRLAVAMDPFAGTKYESQVEPLNVRRVMYELENIYKTELGHYLKSLGNQFAQMVQGSSVQSSASSMLPSWTQPGGLDLPTNPYQILTARITTAWVMRFRESLSSIISGLKGLNESLLAMRAGILDLHDITLGELRLLGVRYAKSDLEEPPTEIADNLKQDLNTIPVRIQKYFQLTQWQPSMVESGDVIDGQQVRQNLLRLRLLKSLAWLDDQMPATQETILGLRVFIQKIHEHLFSPDELSPERAKELEKQLVTAFSSASVTQDEIQNMDLLMTYLANLQALAQEQKWAPVLQAFFQKTQMAANTLELLGVSATQTVDQATTHIHQSVLQFNQQLSQVQSACQSADEMLFLPLKGPFQLGSYQFPLTIICSGHQLYLIRQPGDYLKSLTTIIMNNQPVSRIFIGVGARPMTLVPMKMEMEMEPQLTTQKYQSQSQGPYDSEDPRDQ